MPRYYCDYCDTYLTHDSPSVRKQHNAGYKHKANVRTYYQQFEEQQTQSLIDQRIKEHLGQTAAFGHQVGASFQQHLVSFQSNPQRPRLPVLPPPGLPIAASSQAPINSTLLPGMRPALLPRPLPGFPGYGAPPTVPLSLAPPGATSLPMQMNSLPRLPTMNPPATGGMITNGGYDASNVPGAPILQRPGGPSAPPSGSASQDGFTYSQTSETNH